MTTKAETEENTVIIVDDDIGISEIIEVVAHSMGFSVHTATNAKAFMDIYAQSNPSIILMDIVMPDMDGIELLNWLTERNCTVPIVLISGYDGRYLDMASRVAEVNGANILGMLTKPFDLSEIEVHLRNVLNSADN
jgi:DNA-binding NtrC family response regulator